MDPLLLDETAIIGQAFAIIGLFWLLVYVVVVWGVLRYRKGIIRTLMLVVLGTFTLFAMSLGYIWFG
ncbi:MAG: hypothetical protein ACRYG7_04465 [Janthinobacterium lividum]|jgi:hypothetical protein